MSKRQITQEQLNRLFCSPKFIQKVRISGRPSAQVFQEATDKEIAEWLADGTKVERHIRSSDIDTKMLRGLRGGIIGIAIACASMIVAAIFSPAFRESVGPGTHWQIGTQSFGWPAPFLVFLIIFGLPSALAGPLVAKLATNRLSLWAGLFGIVVGCWWHIHLSTLGASVSRASLHQEGITSITRLSGSWLPLWFINAEYDLLVQGGVMLAIIMFLLPLFCAIGAVWSMNYWVKCWKS